MIFLHNISILLIRATIKMNIIERLSARYGIQSLEKLFLNRCRQLPAWSHCLRVGE